MILPWSIKNKGKCIICCRTEVQEQLICRECQEKYKTTDLKVKKRLQKLGYL